MIVFVSLGAYYFVRFGYYPVAIINFRLITASALNEEYAVVYRYYAGAVLLPGKNVEMESLEFKKELRRATLQDLIEKSLISQELEKRVGRDLVGIVEKKINFSTDNKQNLEEAARLLYGLNLADFKEMILAPRAEREILEGRLFLEKKNLDEWVAEATGDARVFILTPEFFWKDGSVVLRG